VEDILKILDTSKAIGPDLLNPRLFKEAAYILKYPLCTLFNLSLTLSLPFVSVFIFSEILSKYDCFAFNISLLHLLRIFGYFPHCPIVLVFFAFL
jgi:hypothetical protein